MKSLAGSHLRQIDGVLLDDGTARPFRDQPAFDNRARSLARARARTCTSSRTCGKFYRPLLKRLNPTESGKAIVKAGSTRRFGQLFT